MRIQKPRKDVMLGALLVAGVVGTNIYVVSTQNKATTKGTPFSQQVAVVASSPSTTDPFQGIITVPPLPFGIPGSTTTTNKPKALVVPKLTSVPGPKSMRLVEPSDVFAKT